MLTPDVGRQIIRDLLVAIGEDPNREGLIDTPNRVVKSWDKLFGGYKQDPANILATSFTETNKYDQMIVLRDIDIASMCEHHILPFYGKAHIGYIPDGKVVGISKLARLVECFARRLQIQERLTQQIADAIDKELKPLGVGVLLECQHSCMIARGVEKQNSIMVTAALREKFYEDQIRAEFYRLCGK